MRFFVPAADTPEQAEDIRRSVVEWLGSQLGTPIDDRRVRRLEFTHEGRDEIAEVGETLRRVGEPVILILHTHGLYYVCTPNRGVARDMPYLVGGHEVTDVEDFDT